MTYVAWDDEQYAEARAIHEQVGLVDMHVDFLIQRRLFGYDPRREHRAGMQGQPLWWHCDLPRMKQAGYAGGCLGIHWWPFESERGWAEAMRQIDELDRIAESDPLAMRVRGADGWAEAQRQGRVGLQPGVEGAHILNGKLERVEELARRGVAYLTLAHFSRNAACSPSMGRGANEREGLTGLGRELVAELNRCGVAVDVSHVNMPGVLEACSVTTRPVFATHTGVKARCDVPRNVSDAAIDAIAATDGAIGVIVGPMFLNGTLHATSADVADHIDHIVQRVGARHVCTGTDYDGWLPRICRDHRDCRDYVKVTAELLRRGYTHDDLAAILRHNLERVQRAACGPAT